MTYRVGGTVRSIALFFVWAYSFRAFAVVKWRTHCHWELYHVRWTIILDDKFMTF